MQTQHSAQQFKMSKIIFSILLFLNFNVNAQVNYFKIDTSIFSITYKVKNINETKDTSDIKYETYKLDIGKNYSKYYPLNYEIVDSIINIENEENENLEPLLELPIIFKDYKSDMYLLSQQFLIIEFEYEEKNNLIWTLTEDTCTYLTYLCKKATTNYKGRNYIAWFTTEIPIKDGPYIFSGLPGLILKIYDEKKMFEFISSNLNNSSNLILKKNNLQNNNFKKTTYTEFKNIKDNYKINGVEFILNYIGNIKIQGKISNKNFNYLPMELF